MKSPYNIYLLTLYLAKIKFILYNTQIETQTQLF